MRAEIFTTWEEISLLGDHWNSLLISSNSDTIFLTWEWILAWKEITQDHLNPVVIAVWDDEDNLVGIAPFYQFKLKLLNMVSFKGLRILGDYATGSEYHDWILSPKHEDEVAKIIARQLLQAKELWDVIWMPDISGWNGACERLTRAADSVGILYRDRTISFSNYALPDSPEKFEASFSAKRRQQLRRKRKQLMSKPGTEIIFCQTEEDLPKFISALFDLHNRRRMLLNDPGCFIRKPAEADFYRIFLPIALKKGWLRMTALSQDGIIQAIQIGYAYNGDYLQMQEGFNPDYVDGAGNVLRHFIIENAIQEGLKNYDFLGGFTEHKRRWKAKERLGHDLLFARPSLKNRLLFITDIWPSGRYLTQHGLYDGSD